MDLPEAFADESSSPPRLAGTSQARPSLLPAFEPLPTSTDTLKRKHGHSSCKSHQYPTPVPTSSTGLLPSSPSQLQQTRPALKRTTSTASERVPLSNVPALELAENGQVLLLGRSSAASQYQLSANRLISRVHARAFFDPPSTHFEPGRVVIECSGWNGLKVLCRGRVHQLGKGDTFSSDRPLADIMLDVQDARVLIRWPESARRDSPSVSPNDSSGNPGTAQHADALTNGNIPSSPPDMSAQLRSPVSPSPRVRHGPTASTTFIGLPSSDSSEHPIVEVYEDSPSGDEGASKDQQAGSSSPHKTLQSFISKTEVSSPLSSAGSLSDHNEENDPIVHSMGPYGENLLPKMAAIQTGSPERPRRDPLRESVSPKQPQHENKRRRLSKESSNLGSRCNLSPIRNHVVNQLAYSRLHSVPLSIILSNLPANLKGTSTLEDPLTTNDASEFAISRNKLFSRKDLQQLLSETACVGEIVREGKDAAGKQLENEFYYVPELDTDDMRKSAVKNSLGKPGLRSVRKQHKQYFWKRPRN